MMKLLQYLLLVTTVCGVGCSKAPPSSSSASQAANPVLSPPVEKRDLAALRQRGTLRILVRRFDDQDLPRHGSSIAQQREEMADFAQQLGLQPEWVYIADFNELIPALLDGRGDVIVANMTVTKSRKHKVAFTVPLDSAHEQLIASATNRIPKKLDELAGRTLGVQQGTTFFETALDLKDRIPGLKIRILPAEWTREHMLSKLAEGDIDLIIQDSNLLNHLLAGRSDISILWTFEKPRTMAWAIRKDSDRLRGALNRFLYQQCLVQEKNRIHTGDFQKIKERKVLRLIMRNNASAYFLWRGELLGFEYELASRFASSNNLRLEVVVAPTHRDMIPMLVEGEGDIVAAFLAETPERLARGVAFSRPYHYATELLVVRADDNRINTPSELAGRTVVVRRSSSYWETLRQWQKKGIDFTLRAAPETMETEEIIAKVADGTYDLTAADSHILGLEQTWRKDVRSAFPLGDPVPHGWVVRKGNDQLLEKINTFFNQEYRGLFYNMTYNKYFKKPREAPPRNRSGSLTASDGKQLSPYDEIVKNRAAQYGFDWRLICAQMYQESRFDPEAISWSGAQGLMQLMPKTAREMGFDNLKQPASGIHAGVKYLDWIRRQFSKELTDGQVIPFSLAAYNAGIGHVRDAQRLARKQGWNPDIWFGHVEKAMLLLAQPEYARHARYGYCRGQEPVRYVRQIQTRYDAYRQLIGESQ